MLKKHVVALPLRRASGAPFTNITKHWGPERLRGLPHGRILYPSAAPQSLERPPPRSHLESLSRPLIARIQNISSKQGLTWPRTTVKTLIKAGMYLNYNTNSLAESRKPAETVLCPHPRNIDKENYICHWRNTPCASKTHKQARCCRPRLHRPNNQKSLNQTKTANQFAKPRDKQNNKGTRKKKIDKQLHPDGSNTNGIQRKPNIQVTLQMSCLRGPKIGPKKLAKTGDV